MPVAVKSSARATITMACYFRLQPPPADGLSTPYTRAYTPNQFPYPHTISSLMSAKLSMLNSSPALSVAMPLTSLAVLRCHARLV